MEKTQLVFLLGLSHSGKDTVGKMFVDKGFTRVSFGDALKQEYADIHGIDVNVLHEQGPEKEKHRPEIIKYAEAARAKDEMCWVNKAFAPYMDEHGNFKEGLKLVITDSRRNGDVRWAYELKNFIANVEHHIDLKLYLINRPGIIDTDGLTHETIGYAKGLHLVSGPEIPIIDATIYNTGTIEELGLKVERIFNEYAF